MFKIEFKNIIEIAEDEETLLNLFNGLIEMLESHFQIKRVSKSSLELDMNYLNMNGAASFAIFFEKYDGSIQDEYIYVERVNLVNKSNYEDRVKQFLQYVYESI